MLSAHVPTLLALVGTALMGIVIFAPAHGPSVPAISFAPPLFGRLTGADPEAAARFASFAAFADDGSRARVRDRAGGPALNDDTASGRDAAGAYRESPAGGPAWPGLVDARARDCDTAVRLALVQALATVHGPWAAGILDRAVDDEPDPVVRAAIREALGNERPAR